MPVFLITRMKLQQPLQVQLTRKMEILRIVSEFSFLCILLDGSEWFFSGNLHLCTGFFWYFNNEIKNSITQVQWNVMPWWHLHILNNSKNKDHL